MAVAFEIQAHRGNDLAALRGLLVDAPSSVEIDIGATNDGSIVAGHDPTSACGRHWRDLTRADALALGAVPLEQLLDAAGRTQVVVEAKSASPDTVDARAFARALAPFLPRVALASFDERVLAAARRIHRETPATFLFRSAVSTFPLVRAVGPHSDLVDAELVRAAHLLGLRVVPWTVNNPLEMRALVDLGVDGLVTDRPALLAEVLDERRAVAA